MIVMLYINEHIISVHMEALVVVVTLRKHCILNCELVCKNAKVTTGWGNAFLVGLSVLLGLWTDEVTLSSLSCESIGKPLCLLVLVSLSSPS